MARHPLVRRDRPNPEGERLGPRHLHLPLCFLRSLTIVAIVIDSYFTLVSVFFVSSRFIDHFPCRAL